MKFVYQVKRVAKFITFTPCRPWPSNHLQNLCGPWTECRRRGLIPVQPSAFQHILSWGFLKSSEESQMCWLGPVQYSLSRYLSLARPYIRSTRMESASSDHSPMEALDRANAEATDVKIAQNVANRIRSATSTTVGKVYQRFLETSRRTSERTNDEAEWRFATLEVADICH
jgi:hypothetical protein